MLHGKTVYIASVLLCFNYQLKLSKMQSGISQVASGEEPACQCRRP